MNTKQNISDQPPKLDLKKTSVFEEPYCEFIEHSPKMNEQFKKSVFPTDEIKLSKKCIENKNSGLNNPSINAIPNNL
jgi:hypothetical protein